MGLQETHVIASIKTLLRHDERLIYFLFHHMNSRLRLSATELLAEARDLSCGDRLLVQAALDFWNGEGHLNLAQALRSWDDDNITAFVRAVLGLRGIDVEYLVLDEDLC